MASGLTASGGDAAGEKRSALAAERTRLIEKQLRSTRGQVKWTELVTALLLFAAGSLIFLFAFVLVDHWVVRGGVGFWGRLFFLLTFLVAAGVFLMRAVGPLMTRRINTLYAAATIERGQPALKNSLVNFLLLRSRPQDVNPAVFKAIQRRAARDLEDINPEAVIDHTHLIHAGYVLMAVVAVCCVYTLLSSKSPFRSVGRMFVPWADVEAPTRVGFSDVRPGSRQAFHDEFIDVSVLVQGIDDDEPVTLYYSTADRQSVDMPLRMTRPEGSFRHQVTLSQGSSGIQQDTKYYIAAGDARTHTYSIHVESAPAIIVDRVDFDYPDYTALGDRGQRGQGDIVVLEGTRVTLGVRANQSIQEAFVDFDCDGSRDLDMEVEGKLASVSFTLRLNEKRTAGEHESYQIRFTNEQGQENPRPARYRIEVTPDAAPEIEIRRPMVDEIEVPLNGGAEIEVKARDRDFQLSNVTLHARRDGQVLLRRALLEDLHEGEFIGTYQLQPSRLGLKVGDEIVYWADARDNKHPRANRTQTIEYRLRVVEPAEQPPREEQQPADQETRQDEQPGSDTEAEQDPMPGHEDQGSDADTEQGASEENAEDGESETKERIDPEAQPGEAFEEILKRLEEQDRQPNPDEQAGDQQQQSTPKQEPSQEDGTGEPSQDSDPQAAGEQSSEESSGEKNPSGEQEGAGGQGQSGGAQESSEGGEQQGSGAGESQESGSGEQPSSSGGKRPSSDTSEAASKQQSPGGDASQSGGNGAMNANESSGSSGGSQSSGGQDGADQGQSSPAAKDGTPQRGRSGSSGDPQRGDSGRADRETSGDGGQTAGEANEGSNEKSNESDKQSDARGGNPKQQQGTGGAGEKGDDDAGTGSKQKHTKPKNKQQQTAPSDQEAAKDEASPPSESGRESDSQGDNSGERSGGGNEGAGQSADSEGTGGAGSNSASEEGAGQSEGAGKGPTSSQTGDKSASDSASDRPGEKTSGGGKSGAGQGSSEGQSPGSSPGKGSGEPMGGDSSPGKGSSQPAGDSQASGAGAGQTPGGGSTGDASAPSGGRQSGDKDNAAESSDNEQVADDPNLEYTRQATDLALEYLRDQLQQDRPDQELLDRLQWTREDMQMFVKHWEQLKRDAAEHGEGSEASSDGLREALRGLGLRPRGTQIESGQTATDQFRRLRESRRTSPPPEYADQFRYFTEGTSRRRATPGGTND